MHRGGSAMSFIDDESGTDQRCCSGHATSLAVHKTERDPAPSRAVDETEGGLLGVPRLPCLPLTPREAAADTRRCPQRPCPPPQVVRSATPVTRANPRRHGGDVSGDGGAAGPSARGSCQRRRRRRGEGAVPSSDEREHPPPQRRRSRRRRKGRGAATLRQNWTIPVGDSSW